jgi:hypothetical protein
LASKISTPTLQNLIKALESGDARQLQQCVAANRALLIPNPDGFPPPFLWGFLTPYGYCPVKVPTKLSKKIAKRSSYHHTPRTLQEILQDPMIAELDDVFQSGLVPFSMAGDIGEAERASACKEPFVWFTLDEPDILDHWPAADSSEWNDGWGSFFGKDGFTKCSYMLTVTQRAAIFDPAAIPRHDFMVHGVLTLIVQSWPEFFSTLPIGTRYGSCKTGTNQPLTTFYGTQRWARIGIMRDLQPHTICLVVVAALLVCDQVYAHPHVRTGEHSVNGRLIACPVCVGGKGLLEDPWTMLSRNTHQNIPYSVPLSQADRVAAAAARSSPAKRASKRAAATKKNPRPAAAEAPAHKRSKNA